MTDQRESNLINLCVDCEAQSAGVNNSGSFTISCGYLKRRNSRAYGILCLDPDQFESQANLPGFVHRRLKS